MQQCFKITRVQDRCPAFVGLRKAFLKSSLKILATPTGFPHKSCDRSSHGYRKCLVISAPTEICSGCQSLLYISKTFCQISIGIRGSHSCFRRFFAIPSATSLRYSLHFNRQQFRSSSRPIVDFDRLRASAITLLLFPACTNLSIMFLSFKERCCFL